MPGDKMKDGLISMSKQYERVTKGHLEKINSLLTIFFNDKFINTAWVLNSHGVFCLDSSGAKTHLSLNEVLINPELLIIFKKRIDETISHAKIYLNWEIIPHLTYHLEGLDLFKQYLVEFSNAFTKARKSGNKINKEGLQLVEAKIMALGASYLEYSRQTYCLSGLIKATKYNNCKVSLVRDLPVRDGDGDGYGVPRYRVKITEGDYQGKILNVKMENLTGYKVTPEGLYEVSSQSNETSSPVTASPQAMMFQPDSLPEGKTKTQSSSLTPAAKKG